MVRAQLDGVMDVDGGWKGKKTEEEGERLNSVFSPLSLPPFSAFGRKRDGGRQSTTVSTR